MECLSHFEGVEMEVELGLVDAFPPELAMHRLAWNTFLLSVTREHVCF